jgi:hypothetical protein
MSEEIEKLKNELVLKPLNGPEELRNWMHIFLDIKFPMGTVYPGSTHGPVDAMWRIYELMKTGDSRDVPQVCMLASRDSYKTLSAAAIEVLCMLHFEISVAHGAAIKSQSEKAIQYVNSFFRKLSPYLEANGWRKLSDSKAKIEWLTSKGDAIYLRIVVATVAGMNCVKGNTSIKTNKGNLSASTIYKRLKNGEDFLFWSHNHNKKYEEYKPVICTQKNKHKKIIKITTSNGILECSLDHKIYIKGRGYVKAKDIKVGEKAFRKNRDASSALGFEKAKEFIEKKGYKLKTTKDKYKNTNTILEMTCKDGHLKKCSFNEFKNKKRRGCLACKSISFEKIKAFFESKKYRVNIEKESYKNTKQKIQTICDNGHEYSVSYHDFKHKNARCSQGDCHKKRHDTNFVVKYIQEQGYKTDLKQYKNQYEPISVICPNDHKTMIMFSNFYNHGKRCKHCYRPYSKAHQEIVGYIKTIYKGKIEINNRDIIHPLEIDIYIPEFKFGVEFDGLYWHSEKVKKNAKKINIEKACKINQKNINILAIFEDEWSDPLKQELVKSMIKSRLGIYDKKMRASKLEIKKINKNIGFKSFFDKYHLDGHVQASFAYGLFDGDELVSCMSFRVPFNNKNYWEIARFATKSGLKIYGNASKIIKCFIKEYNKKLITYSNNRLSLGNTYQKLGFKEITQTTEPSYYYTDFQKRLWRFKCRKINDPDILNKYPTEKAQAEGGVFSRKFLGHSRALYKIYDYGHRKWSLEC